MRALVSSVALVTCLLVTTGCETTKHEQRYHEYVVIEKGRNVRHHHHHDDGDGGRKTYRVYEVKGTDGAHIHHHYVGLTPKEEKALRALHEKKHAEHHGRNVRATKTHTHRHQR